MNILYATQDEIKNRWGYDSGDVGYIAKSSGSSEHDSEQDQDIQDLKDRLDENERHDQEQQTQLDTNDALDQQQQGGSLSANRHSHQCVDKDHHPQCACQKREHFCFHG